MAEIYTEFCDYIHRLNRCDGCGKPGEVELAHLEGVAARWVPGGPRARVRERQGLSILYGLGLCAGCHRTGPESYHNLGQRGYAERHFGSEANLLAAANLRVMAFLIGRMT